MAPVQATLPSFFKTKAATPKKRAASPIDLTLDSDNDEASSSSRPPPLKKLRTSGTVTKPKPTSTRVRKERVYIQGDPSPPIIVTKPKIARNWAYAPVSSEPSGILKPFEGVERAAKQARRAAFANKLSLRTSWQEQRHRNLEDSASPANDQTGSDLDETGNFSEDPDGTDRPKGKGKSRSGKKVASSTSKGKGKAVVGPSGQTWTPLEKQV